MSSGIKKIIHICIIITIIVAIIFAGLIIILQYDETGETNMPFEISKITIISTTDAQDVEDSENLWNELVSQNNDIYIDIKKNDNYSQTQIIDSVTIDNFIIVEQPRIGNITIYRPSTSELQTFENIEEYETTEIIATGEQATNIQNMEISNQGGRIAFRCANNNLGSYISNVGTELNYSNLLELIGVSNEDLQAKVSFDVEILLRNGNGYKTTIELNLPVEGVVTTGKSSIEITELNTVFKRVEN